MKKHNSNVLLKDIVYTSLLSLITGVLASVGFVVLIMVCSGSVLAEESLQQSANTELTINDVQHGSLLLKLASGGVSVDAPLLYTDVSMQVSGMINRVRVKQQFHNPGDDWVEGIYVFPLPENAAVDRMSLRIGERIIEGEIKERQEAKQIYQAALQSGKKASLLSQERANIFTTAVANIGPDERVEVMIEYQQDLLYEGGEFSLRFPLVVAPRYIPGVPVSGENISGFNGSGWAVDTDQVPDASRITPPVVDPVEGEVNPVSIEIRLDAGFPLARLESRYHEIDRQDLSSGEVILKLRDQHVPADRDFELIWVPKVGHAPTGALFTENWQGDEYALLMLMPPVAGESTKITTPREVIFVVDTSGSMHGASLAQAKDALKMALSRLEPKDYFNVIQFNSFTHALFNTAVPASAANVRRALSYVGGLQADGGTEILPALQQSLDGRHHEGKLRQVIFLTDGSVGNEEELFAAIEKRLGSSRLFTVGIGSAPNSFFMTRAATFGRGSFTYIGDIAEVQEKMGQLFSKLESPVLTDIRAEWSPGQSVEMWPARIPDLYLGEPVVIAVKLAESTTHLSLDGQVNGKSWQQSVELTGGGDHSGISAIWARRKIADLMDQKVRGRSDEEVKQAITQLALHHQMVSRYTSLVAVDKTPSRPMSEDINRKAVPTNLPQGWNAQKVFGALPQTATPAPLHLILGMLSLLIGWLIKVFKSGRAATSTRLVEEATQ